MKSSDIRTAAVLGAGTMGHGIAHVLASIGVETRLFDVAPSAVEKGLTSVRSNLEKGVAKGKVATVDRDAALAKLSGTTQLDEAVRGAQIVIEAVPEKLELKQSIFRDLGSKCCSRPTRARCRSPRSPKSRAIQSASSACTFSTPCTS